MENWNENNEYFEPDFSKVEKNDNVKRFHFIKMYIAFALYFVSGIYFLNLTNNVPDDFFSNIAYIVIKILYAYIPFGIGGLAGLNVIISHFVWITYGVKNLGYNTFNIFGQFLCMFGSLYIAITLFILKGIYILFGILFVIAEFWLVITGDGKEKMD